MAVVPMKFDGVLADGLCRVRFCSRLKHGQSTRGEFGRITRLPVSFAALFVAQSARAGIAQIHKVVMRAMAVLPFDVHTSAGGDVDLDGFGVGGSHEFSRYLAAHAAGVSPFGVAQGKPEPQNLLTAKAANNAKRFLSLIQAKNRTPFQYRIRMFRTFSAKTRSSIYPAVSGEWTIHFKANA
jgi:hypothetical protein